MTKSKLEKLETNIMAFVIIIILAGMGMLLAVWYFSYKTITDPGVQKAATAALPLLLA